MRILNLRDGIEKHNGRKDTKLAKYGVGGGGDIVTPDEITLHYNGSGKLEIKDLGVKTGKINTKAVTTAKLDDEAVTTIKIKDEAVTTEKIAPADTEGYVLQTVKNADNELEVNWVDPEEVEVKVDDETIDINADDELEVKNLGISTAKIQDKAVTTPKIAPSSTAGYILKTVNNGSAGLNVQWAEPSETVVDDVTIHYNSDDELEVKDDGISTDKLQDEAVTTAKIEDEAVTTIKIDALAVTTSRIANEAVTTGKIEDLAVTNAKIAGLAVTTEKIRPATTAGKVLKTIDTAGVKSVSWEDASEVAVDGNSIDFNSDDELTAVLKTDGGLSKSSTGIYVNCFEYDEDTETLTITLPEV